MSLSSFTSRVFSRLWFVAVILFSALILTAEPGFAARVTQVKGSQVLIDLEGESAASVLRKRFVVMVGDKRRAIVEITKAKGQKAVGRVLKGRAAVDGELVALSRAGAARKRTARADSDADSESSDSSDSPSGATTYGVLLGMNMATQNVTLGSEDVPMAGSGFSLKAFGDFNISGDLSLVGRLGMEQFNVTGDAKSGTKKTEGMYLTADLLVKYQFLSGSFKPFVLGGLGIHMPQGFESTAIDPPGTTTVFVFGGGANYYLSSDMYLTAMAEYGYFPPGEGVTTSWLAFRGGLGMAF